MEKQQISILYLVIGSTWPGLKLTIYEYDAPGKHANHYTTDVVDLTYLDAINSINF